MPTIFDPESQLYHTFTNGKYRGSRRSAGVPQTGSGIPGWLQPYIMAGAGAIHGAYNTWAAGESTPGRSSLSGSRKRKRQPQLLLPAPKSAKRLRFSQRGLPATSSSSGSGGKPTAHSSKMPRKSYKKKGRRKARTFPKRRTAARRSLKNSSGFGGKFKKARKISASKGMLHGSVRKEEYGGAIQDSKCQYIGHSSAQYKSIHWTVWETLVRHLLRKEGREISDLNESVRRWIRVSYFESTESDAAVQNVKFDATNVSVHFAASGIAELLYAANVANEDFVVDDARLYELDPDLAPNQVVSKITLRNMRLDIKSENILTLQNRTAGATGSGSNDVGNSNEVTNNPVVGKLYAGYKGGFLPVTRPGAAIVGFNGFVPDSAGLIFPVSVSTTFPFTLQKPPNPNFFKYCKKYTRVYLAPGQTKNSKCMHMWKGTFTGFMQTQRRLISQFGAGIFTGSLPSFQHMGQSKLYALERLIDTRTGEPEIQIGYQTSLRVSVSGYVTNYSPIPEFVIDS